MSDNSNSDKTLESYKYIFESSLDAILLTHPDGTIFYANSAAEKLYGYTQKEILDLGRSGIVDTNDPNFQFMLDERARLGKSKGELILIKKDGSKFPAEVSTNIFKDKNGNVNTFLTIRDITQRRLTENHKQELLEREQQLTEELQKSNEELKVTNTELKYQREELIHLNQALIESEKRMDRSQKIAHLGSWELDIDNNYLSWSNEVYRIFGLQPQEFDSTYDAFLDYVHPDDRKAVDEAYYGSIRDGKDTYELEHRIVRKNTGEVLIVHEKCEHFRDSSGKIVRSVGMIHDITERVKAEDKIKRILESIAESYVEYDNEWRYVDVNTKSEELIGVNKDKLVNKIVWKLFPQLIGTKHYKELHRAKKENIPVRFETKSLISKNWYEINAYPHPEGLSVYSHNINVRKEAEEVIRISEEKYYTLYSSMNEGVALHDIVYNSKHEPVDYMITDVNESYEFILGLNKKEVVGKKASEIYGTNKPPYIEIYSQVAETGESTEFETYFEPMNKHFKISVISPKKGKFATIFEDISIRRQTERNLLESEEKYRSILNNLQDAYIRADKEGNIIMASPSAVRLYRFNSTKEMIGCSAKSFYKNLEDRNHVLEELKKHGKIENNEIEALRKDGTSFTASQNAQFYYDYHGQIQGTETLVRDITERKSIEAALKKSKNILAEAQRIAHIGSWEWNIQTGEINWSSELYSIYKVDPDTFTPTMNSFADYMHPDDEEYVNQYVDQLLSEFKSQNFDFRIVLDDGSIRVLNTLAEIAEFDENGKPSIIVGTNQDITERKEIEIKLNENITKLAQSNKELEQFAYITSHDLREPLRMITSFLQLLERKYKDQLDKDANEYIKFAVDGAKRLDAMTNDLLEYSRITSEKREVTTVNFEQVLEKVLTNLKVQIEENNAIITHDPLPTLYGDEQLKLQLFQNLISNSIKYRSQKTPKIHISARKERNQYLFSVKDNGIGMSPKYLEQIFTIFKRLHRHEEYEGTGIGLAIAQKIVQQQGGQIWAESELGKGSTFYFTISAN
jgi:PAS domain S-box-containing protein